MESTRCLVTVFFEAARSSAPKALTLADHSSVFLSVKADQWLLCLEMLEEMPQRGVPRSPCLACRETTRSHRGRILRLWLENQNSVAVWCSIGCCAMAEHQTSWLKNQIL